MTGPDLASVLRYLERAGAWATHLSQAGVDSLSHVVLSTHPSHAAYASGVRRLRRLCREAKLVPSSCQVPMDVVADPDSPRAVSQTPFSDVWSYILDGRKVAVKALRLHEDEVHDVQQAYLHELIMWRCLRHRNIVPFIGTSVHFPVSLVSEWMSGGTITAFLRRYPDWERSYLVIDILRGLGFMHSLDVVHGDLKPANVLVDFQGHARLTDFGLAIALNATVASRSTTDNGMGTPQYMAPELFAAQESETGNGRPTKAGDVYALALTSWHVYSLMIPFPGVSSSVAVSVRVRAGVRPSRTKEMDELKLTDMQWQSIVAAWDQEPSRRPVLSSGGEPMIYSWRPEAEAIHSVRHCQPDLDAEEAGYTLQWLLDLVGPYSQHSNVFPQGVIEPFSFVARLGSIPIRHHEETWLRSIYDRVPLQHKPAADYGSLHFKIFLLLKAHFLRLDLTQELASDQAVVLERVFFLFSVCAHHDWSNSDRPFKLDHWPYSMFPFMRMCVQGMQEDDPELLQIPHFENDVIGRFHAAGIESMRDVVYMDVHQRHDLLEMDTHKIRDVEAFLSSYPALSVTTQFLERDRFRAGEHIILEVTLRQTLPGAERCQANVWNHYPSKHAVKWWVGVSNQRCWLANAYVTVPETLTVRLEFVLPQGMHQMSLTVDSDSYMGLKRDIELGDIFVGN